MAESSDSLQMETDSHENLDSAVCDHNNVGDSENTIQSITDEIINVLQLTNNENSNQIVTCLLEKGRQSLIDHKEHIHEEIYTTAMDNISSKLLELLKMYFEQIWKTEYASSNEWFSLFLKRYQSEENHDLYECVLTRTAEYGSKYMKSCPMLSIILQLLFESIDDKCLQETNTFNDLWFTTTNDGLKSITKYADYIIEEVMNEQINEKNSALFQALRTYYQPQLFPLLKQSNIRNKQHLYDFSLDSVTEHGWLTGIEVIKNKTTPKLYEGLLENIHAHKRHRQLQEGKTECSDDQNATLANIQSELISPEPATKHNDTLEHTDQETSTTFLNNSNPTTTNMSDPPMKSPIQNNNQNIQQTTTFVDDQVNITAIHPIDMSTNITSEYHPIPNTICYDNEKELTVIQNCKCGPTELFHLQDLVQAGQLQYTSLTLDGVAQHLVDHLSYEGHTFTKFVRNCLIPIMYLLKRQQNLDTFFTSLTFKYQTIERPTERTNLSLRMFLHLLFMSSDVFLQRIVMSLLSKRNPVPFISPTIQAGPQEKPYEFMPGIIHVWNSTRPTILSFGIGLCKGKSTLLNQLFQSTFEQTVESIYFQQTIDIDFGYCFSPERTLNIADTHGLIDQRLLEEIHPLFDGFLIQIDMSCFNQQPQLLMEYLKLLPANKFQIVIIRDTPVQSIQKCSEGIHNFLDRSRVPSSHKPHVYPLVNISNTNDRDIGFAIRKIREDLLAKIQSEVRITNDKHQTVSLLQKLMKGNYVECLQRLNQTIQPLKGRLLQRNQQQTHQNFPLYSKFQELCQLRQKLKKLDFYCAKSENMFEIYGKLNKLECELDPNTTATSPVRPGEIFELFIDILKSDNALMGLDLLSTELKSELLSSGGDKIAGDLTVENAFLSLEVLWRNAIVCYNHTTNAMQSLIAKSYYDFIATGFPFEIIDGDNLNFQHQFLTPVLKNFESERILVISIIGPQNSGKSTLLNYMFGTLFDVREGRCTRGMYGSFVKLVKSNGTSSETLNSEMQDIDYIMLIDTEGLLSIEKSDNEYDRRLVLFCLAVSHLVIVNMMGDVNETLKDMLTLCADSLKQIGVNKVDQPIVHFVLNQKADPNLKNHIEAIDGIIRDFKEKDLAGVMDISPETFHTLPSAFKKERVSNDAGSSCFLRTEPDFIQRTQELCDKIIRSAKSTYSRSSQTFSDPPQWLRTAVTVFDTLQKFPDLTYFKDVKERQQDDRIRQHIGERISETLPADYREQTIIDLCELTENEIRKQIQAKFDVHQNDLDNDLKLTFKATNASERIRERSTQFLKRQVTEISNAWCTAALQAHDQKRMEVLARDGSDDLRKLIDDLIKSGRTMTREEAEKEFDGMWVRKLDSIQKNFDPEERLKQAIKFIYGNYNIFEKKCLASHEHILQRLPFITELSKQSNMKLVLIIIQSHFAQDTANQRHSALENHWTSSTTNIAYTLATIESFSHLNKQIIIDIFTALTIDQNEYATGTMDHDERNRPRGKGQRSGHSMHNFMKKGLNAVGQYIGIRAVKSASTEQTMIINPASLQSDFIRHVNQVIHSEMNSTPNAVPDILSITKLFNKIVEKANAAVHGYDTVRRPIEVDLIQKIVSLINTAINEINLELVVFHFSLSKQTKSSIHTFILILLTMFYYDEQKNHFDQQLSTLNTEKQSLLTYFISMVVPDAQCDKEGAELFAGKVKNACQLSLNRDAQIIIKHTIETQQNLNRKHIQVICDGKLHAAADDDDWLFRYIDAPTDIIIGEFQILWTEVKAAINQQLEEKQNQRRNLLIEFFNRIEYIISSLMNEGASVQFIDDIFAASGGAAAENLTNKGQCMVLLLYAYLSGDRIQSETSYMVFNETYTLKEKGLKLIEKLPTPSPGLANLIDKMKHTDNSNNNQATIA